MIAIEGFEGFAGSVRATNATQLTRKYPDSAIGDNPVIQTGHGSNSALVAGRTGQAAALLIPIPAGTDFTFGFSFRIIDSVSTYAAGVELISLRTSTTLRQCLFQLNNSGDFRFMRDSSNLLQAASGVIAADTWYQVEARIKAADSGSWVVTLNGEQILSGTGDTKAQTSADSIYLAPFFIANTSSGSGGTSIGRTIFDNIYVKAGLQDFLDVEWKIAGYVPVSDHFTDFAPLTGEDNFAMVDEVPADDNTSYVSSSTNGHRDLYFVNTVIETPIHAVQLNAVALQDDGENLLLITESNNELDDGDPIALGTAYGGRYRVLPTDPNTDEPWTAEGLNAANFGVEVDK